MTFSFGFLPSKAATVDIARAAPALGPPIKLAFASIV